MSKRFLVGIVLVIILVSLNWFTEAFAADLNHLSDEEKAALLRTYQKGQKPEASSVYSTPQIYNSKTDTLAEAFGLENQSPLLRHQQQQEKKVAMVSNNGLTAFKTLKPFGTELFDGAETRSELPVDVISSPDYILGPGDNLIVYLWGRVEQEYTLTIDREGKLFIPQVGTMSVWGLTLDEFSKRAKKQFGTVYSEFDLTVSLGKIRSIRIYVAGEVKQPGAYTVSSLTSLFNALYLAGGPNERGSMRSIKLMRGGKEVRRVDLYRLLLAGDNSADVALQSGDVVFVPVAGAQAAIRGEVRREALYELTGEETINNLITLAGNATPLAHLERVMVERVDTNGEWAVLDIDATEPSKAHAATVTAGDRVTVYSIYDMKKNMVAVFGQVKHAGYYERTDSTKISDIIDRSQLQPYDVYLKRADLFRTYPDNRLEIIPIDLTSLTTDPSADMLMQDKDSIHIYAINEVEWEKHVYIEGEVKRPGRYPLYANMTVADLIFLSGSFTKKAQKHRGEIARLTDQALVDILEVSLEHETGLQQLLTEDDHLYIRQIPEWEVERTVTITGEIRFPGKYSLSNRRETLYEMLQRCGGFTETAFPRGIIVERASIKENLQRMRVDNVIEKSSPIRYDSLGQLVMDNTVEYDASRMSRIIIDMEKIITTHGTEGDIILEPNDRIIIPTIPSGISVIGAVSANGTLKFYDNRTVKDYVKQAGNFTRQADKKQTRLVKANGEVLNGNILGQLVEIGDVIIVPSRIEKEHSWMKSVTSALSAATGVLTSIYIITKL